MSVTFSRAPTTYSSQPPKTYKQTEQCHFFVIDSQNQEEPQPKIIQSIQLKGIEQCCLKKRRSQSYANPNRYEEQCLDFQILTAQEQIRELQKQCLVLEGFLNDMASENAKIQVQMKIKQRSKSIEMSNQKNYISQCPVHGSAGVSLRWDLDVLKKNPKESLNYSNDEISFTTPLLSRNQNTTYQKRLDEAKTVDVNEEGHKKMKLERAVSRKKQPNDKQNRVSFQQKGKKKAPKKNK